MAQASVRNGGSWTKITDEEHRADSSAAHAASAVAFTPAGTIAATDVQAAIEEVASEAGGGGAPTTADYLVGTANAGLSAEIVVGTSPGGELGGTWASPTVDGTHSGSAHHAEDHASRHANAGADAVKLDDLATPDDNTNLNASTSAHGLLKKLSNVATEYMDGTGAWSVPAGGSGGFPQASQVKLTGGQITTQSTTFVDATGLTTTITTGARRCLVKFMCNINIPAISSDVCFDVAIDGTRQGGTSGLIFNTGVTATSSNFPIIIDYLTGVLTAASHTIKIQWRVTNAAATGTIYASAISPAILTVLETNLTT